VSDAGLIAFVARVDGTVTPLPPRPPTLEELQAIVGGYIEVVALRHKGKIIGQMIFNEEGKLEGLSYNAAATFLAQTNGGIPASDFIVGPAVVLAGEAMID
jgi:uncharacterized protein DUF3846